jgi:hypothetical protein
MSEEIVKMHQSVSSFKPTIWLSADRWKMNTWYDMSGNANNMSEHNAITKRKNAAGSWGATQNSIALDPIRMEVSRSPNGWPSGRDYTLVHMTRYTDGVKAVFGTMFPRKELIGYLTPSGMYRAKLSQRLIDNRVPEKIQNWVLVSDQYITCVANRQEV